MTQRKIYIRRFILAVISLSLFITICIYNQPIQNTNMAKTQNHTQTRALA